jgi:LPS O-antigen subunit length determinant protein (WzzB/FepE family)
MAAKIASAFLSELNNYMSSEAGRVALVNRKYLDDQLNRTLDPLIRQNIYNMIAKQIETSMTAEVKENYAFKIIDPPRPPDEKSKPKRTIITIISVFVALFLSIITVFVIEFVKKIKAQMKEAEHE